jgi:hypothetical protein
MIYRSKLVVLTLPSNIAIGDQFNFQNDSDLQDAYIVGISALDSSDLILAPNGATVVSDLPALTITIAELSQKEMIRDHPLTDLQTSNQGGFIRDIFPFKLNWQDSYVTILDDAAISPEEAIPFVVYFVPSAEIKKYENLYQFYINGK